jgi:tripartite-type tricarboxylate transporter receptor subunit TctC
MIAWAKKCPWDKNDKTGRTFVAGLRLALSLGLCVGFSAALAQPCAAQQFPAKPITLVVPYAPGGNVDVTTRVLQSAIGDALGQPIIIENRPGGAGLIAGDYVARAEPDGHTLFVGSNGPVILGPLTMAKPAYRWEEVFAPVSALAIATNLLLVRPSLPVKSVQELVAYAKQNPNKLTLATSSVASINHFLAELFRLKAGITWTEVHYRGNTPAIADLLAGHVDVGFQQLVDAAQHLQGGKLTALAVPGKTRVPALPEVPTMAEAGYPEVEGVTFNGIFAPRNTPRPIVDLLSVTIRAALMKKTAIDQLAALGSQARGSTPEEFTDFLRAETKKWGELVKAANIKPSE